MSRYLDAIYDGARFDVDLSPVIRPVYDTSTFDEARFDKLGRFGFDRASYDYAAYDSISLSGFDISVYGGKDAGFNRSRFGGVTFTGFDSGQYGNATYSSSPASTIVTVRGDSYDDVPDLVEGYDNGVYGEEVSQGFDTYTFDISAYNQYTAPLPGSLYDSDPNPRAGVFDEMILRRNHLSTLAEEFLGRSVHAAELQTEFFSHILHTCSNTDVIIRRTHIVEVNRESFVRRMHRVLLLSPSI